MMKPDKNFSIVITGGIASGKSTLCDELEKNNFYISYADRVAHNILLQDDVITILINHFGQKIINENKIDRRKLGEIVFSNKNELNFLNDLIHPKVIDIQANLLQKSNAQKLIFFEIPLFFEAKIELNFDLVVYISTRKENQISRILQRDSLTKDDAISRIDSQLSDEIKRKRADIVIENNSTFTDFQSKIRAFVKLMRFKINNDLTKITKN